MSSNKINPAIFAGRVLNLLSESAGTLTVLRFGAIIRLKETLMTLRVYASRHYIS